MPTDFRNIQTTRGRGYIGENINKINNGLQELPIEQRAAIIGSIIEESGGDPMVKSPDGKYQGLLQWGADRYVPQSSDKDTELSNQTQYILSTVKDKSGGVNWTHGGRGSGYNTKHDTYDTFNSDKASFQDRFRAFSYGYVRPAGKEDSYNNRLKVAKDVLNRLVVEEKLSKPQPKKWTPMKFEQNQFPSRYSDGGYLDNPWDNLSMADRAEMMKVAIANGITTMPEIRKAYNKFAGGGYKPSSKLQRDIAIWEGEEMQKNASFAEMTRQFNAAVPMEIQKKLQPNQLDALYSYGYNVGMGNLKKRVLPILTAYTQGKATNEDVQKAMWASKDSQLRGLTRRRNWERAMFGGNYMAPFDDNKIGVQIDASRYTLPNEYFEGMGNMIANVGTLQVPMLMDVDPTTLYKPPVIDDTLFQKPEMQREERQEQKGMGIEDVIGMMGMNKL